MEEDEDDPSLLSCEFVNTISSSSVHSPRPHPFISKDRSTARERNDSKGGEKAFSIPTSIHLPISLPFRRERSPNAAALLILVA